MSGLRLELLSPAGNFEIGKAAINCGADAVYIGAPKFGARAAAGNSLKDIESLIKYAHLYNARVYATVNTILYDNELQDAEILIKQLYDAGIDAIIIQDTAILKMDIPPVPLFASTQMHNYETERIKFFDSLGLKRIILARELSLNQIKEIRKQTTAELEFFVHGALCVSFSGQCYFSHATTGRSANRGECSQSCRMLYSLEDTDGRTIVKDKYLLSLKDLNLSAYLKELIDSGITSFKIEGRLKDIFYVKNITAFYRQKLDEIIEGNTSYKKSSSGKIYFGFTPDPEKTFNRGYTDYFISGKRASPGSLNTPKSVGKYIGKVIKAGNNFIEIATKDKINNGDGICWFDGNQSLNGMYVNKSIGNKIFLSENLHIKTGTKIFRNRDNEFIKILSAEKTRRKISVELKVSYDSGNIILYAADEDGNTASSSAKTEPLNTGEFTATKVTLERQFKKSGDTIFKVVNYTAKLDNPFYLSVKAINELRRDVLIQLKEKRINAYKRETAELKKSKLKLKKNLSYRENVANKKAREFYLEYGAENIDDAFELTDNFKGKVIMKTKYCLKKQLNICPLENSEEHDYKNTPLFLRDGKRKYKLIFNCSECTMSIEY